MRRWIYFGVMALVGLGAGPASAQERVEEVDLPRHVVDEVLDFFNGPGTLRFRGASTVPEGRVIQSDVGALRGPLTVEGEIVGDVMVLNGDLVVRGGGRIDGDVTIVGGQFLGDHTSVSGQVTVYSERLAYGRRGDRIVVERRRRLAPDRTRSRISFRNEGSYNRVEGLPIMMGPVVRTGGDDFTRFDAMAIWRTAQGFEPEEFGWFLRAEQHFGADGRLTLGATAHSLVEPIERWGLTDAETSLATFLFHEDFRDYYAREGFSVFLGYEDRDAGLRLRGEYRDEDHAFVPVESPWTLKGGDDPWRPQPLVAQGNVRTLRLGLTVDDRNDREDPSDGWYLDAHAVLGLEGSLVLPPRLDGLPGPATLLEGERGVESDFRTGFLDLRRYARLGPTADVRVRGVLAGSLQEEPLPPQFQHALGGAGSLPGYPLMGLDCGVRDREVSVLREDGDLTVRHPAFAGYGCDRIALLQVEYRGGFSVDVDLGDDEWDEDWNWYPAVDFTPSWTLFANVGRGWAFDDPAATAYPRYDTGTFADVGMGILLGDIGLYWAYPLQGDDHDLNFFVRVDYRF